MSERLNRGGGGVHSRLHWAPLSVYNNRHPLRNAALLKSTTRHLYKATEGRVGEREQATRDPVQRQNWDRGGSGTDTWILLALLRRAVQMKIRR